MIWKWIGIVVIVVFSAVGVVRTGQACVTLYNDYQDFKVIRAWVVQQAKAAKTPQVAQAPVTPK